MQIPACRGEVSIFFACRVATKCRCSPFTLVVRDVRERGRDVEGCIKQWFAFVKPNFEKVRLPSQAAVCLLGGSLAYHSLPVVNQFVEPQRKVADLIVPRGIENRVALGESKPIPA